MANRVSDILTRAQITLMDTDAVRWPISELLLYVNDAIRAVAIHKPDAVAERHAFDLAAGTYQVMPDGYERPIRFLTNITPAGTAKGSIITPVSRDLLDSYIMGWADETVIGADSAVEHVILDTEDDAAFEVFPPNDGTGRIEALLVKEHVDYVPAVANPDQINSYDDAAYDLPTPPSLMGAVLDYTLYRAFSKDTDIATSAGRAQTHLVAFSQALGIKMQTEATNGPFAPRPKPTQ